MLAAAPLYITKYFILHFAKTQKRMEADDGIGQSYPMSAGDGPHGYANNSDHQKRVIEASKDLINEVIQDQLEIDSSCVDGSKAFGIADLGCSVGQNTFMAVQNIIEAAERVYKANNQSNSSSSLEFHVFFNDHYNNDFNSLFRSSSYASKSYYAAGVAGSFYGRLFPKSSLHFVNCSYALHWISQFPKEIVDRKSPAWNGNRIHYINSSEKVYEAYAAQYKKDMECFISARSQEIVNGGLMLIVAPNKPAHCTVSQTALATNIGIFESCLYEMIKLGHVSEEKVETFNVPHYYPTLMELEEIIEKNGNFKIERKGILSRRMRHIKQSVEFLVGLTRAYMEELFKQHFGDEVIPELFRLFADKLAQDLDNLCREYEELFFILKRK